MEALGRMIAVLFGVASLVLLLVYYRTGSARWQKSETVRSMSQSYADTLLSDKKVTRTEWEAFCMELNRLGSYRTELTIYERRRFEGKDGRVYLFSERNDFSAETVLSEGSYVRIVISEEPRGWLETLLFGAECTVLAGGRIS